MDAARLNPAGDFDYEAPGQVYARVRQPDPRIAARIHAALGDARSVVNVGAGAGSYEPTGLDVIAIEPSATMRAQRPPHLAPAIDGTADTLPLGDDAVDAAMATITIHQWPDLEAGLREMRRVARGPVVIVTFDPATLSDFWLADYAPSVLTAEAGRQPALDRVAGALGGEVVVTPLMVPLDCTDGFIQGFYGRPEQLLDPAVRAAQSSWAFGDQDEVARGVARLAADLESGAWDERYGHLRTQPEYEGSLRLVVAQP
ncbi:MAG: class I SAM-dependent methyltransferase [Solirubrobacteraceae bacterium]|nr:class I SAM-dependent methyltransferase [Solirubrobacteraceae bacterium]